MKKQYKPNTAMGLLEYLAQFPDEESARAYLERQRWQGNVACPRCQSQNVRRLPDMHRRIGFWQCNGCRRQFSVRTNSVFQHSNLPLRTWLHAFYAMVTARKGDSSMHLSKELGIMQRHAWFLEHRIRDAMSSGKYDALLKGMVEFDETFVGGRKKNMHASKKKKLAKQGSGTTEMAIVFGGLERRSNRAVSLVIPCRTKPVLHGLVEGLAEKGSIVSTDEYASYAGLDKLGYEHRKVNHKAKLFVDEMASTNGVESMWACLKRGFYGTFHRFSAKHLQRYVDEFDFRWNQGNCRHETMRRIESLAGGCFGRYLSYKALIGKTAAVCVTA
jgi:transposase-like protein